MKRKVRVYKDKSNHMPTAADLNKVAKFFRDSAKHKRKLGGDTAEQNQSINSVLGDKLNMFKQNLSNNALGALVEEELYNVDQAFQYGGDNNPSFTAFGYDPSRAGTDMYADRYYQNALRNQQAKQNFWGNLGNALDDSWGDKAKSKLTDEGKAFVKAQKKNSMGYQYGGVPEYQDGLEVGGAGQPGSFDVEPLAEVLSPKDQAKFDVYGTVDPRMIAVINANIEQRKQRLHDDQITSGAEARRLSELRKHLDLGQNADGSKLNANEVDQAWAEYESQVAAHELQADDVEAQQKRISTRAYKDARNYTQGEDGLYTLNPEIAGPLGETTTIGNTPAEPITTDAQAEATKGKSPGSTASNTNKKVADLGKNKVATTPIEEVTEGNVNPNDDGATADVTGNTMKDELGRISARSRAFGPKHDFLYNPNNTYLSSVDTRRALMPGNRVKRLNFSHNVPQSEYDRVMGTTPGSAQEPSKILPAFAQAAKGPIVDENGFWKEDQGLKSLKKLPMKPATLQPIDATDDDVLQPVNAQIRAGLPTAQLGMQTPGNTPTQVDVDKLLTQSLLNGYTPPNANNQIDTGVGPMSARNDQEVTMANTAVKEGMDMKNLGKQMLGPGMDMIAAFGRHRTEPDFQQQMMDSTSANNVFTPNDEIDRGMNTFNPMGVPSPYGAKMAPQFTGMARFGGPRYQNGGPSFEYRPLPPMESQMAMIPDAEGFDYQKLPMMEAAELGYITAPDADVLMQAPYSELALNERIYQEGGALDSIDNPYYHTPQGKAIFTRKQEFGISPEMVDSIPVPQLAKQIYPTSTATKNFGVYNEDPNAPAYVPAPAPSNENPADAIAAFQAYQDNIRKCGGAHYQEGGGVNEQGQRTFDNPYFSTEQAKAIFARKQELGMPIEQVGKFPVPHVTDMDPAYANYSQTGRANAFGVYNKDVGDYGAYAPPAPVPSDQLASHQEGGPASVDNPYYHTPQGKAIFARRQEFGISPDPIDGFDVPQLAKQIYPTSQATKNFGVYNNDPENPAYGAPVPLPANELATAQQYQLGGTYDLSEDEIAAIFRAGGTVEYL